MGRILDYPEKPSPGLNDYLLVDSSSEGTKKISASNIVTVDSSLTQPGQPADAKKTGDEIASVKADLGNIPAIDSTLTVSGQAADAKVVGDEISKIITKTPTTKIVDITQDSAEVAFYGKGVVGISTNGRYTSNENYDTYLWTPQSDTDIYIIRNSGTSLRIIEYNDTLTELPSSSGNTYYVRGGTYDSSTNTLPTAESRWSVPAGHTIAISRINSTYVSNFTLYYTKTAINRMLNIDVEIPKSAIENADAFKRLKNVSFDVQNKKIINVTKNGTVVFVNNEPLSITYDEALLSSIYGVNRFDIASASFIKNSSETDATVTKTETGVKIESNYTDGVNKFVYFNYIAEFTGKLWISTEASCSAYRKNDCRMIVLVNNNEIQPSCIGEGLLKRYVNVTAGDNVQVRLWYHLYTTSVANIVEYKNIMLAYEDVDYTPFIVSSLTNTITKGSILTFLEATNVIYTYVMPAKKYKCVCFGDSVTGMFDYGSDYCHLIEKNSPIECINVGFSGSTYADHPSEHYVPFSVNRLIDSVVSEDFTYQDAHVGSITSDFYSMHLANLKSVNFTDVDFVTFLAGTNDWAFDIPLLSTDDQSSENKQRTNVQDAVKYCITEILTKYPHLTVIVLSPYYRANDFASDSDTAPNNNGVYLYQVSDAILECAKEARVAYGDLYYNLGANWITKYIYTIDGTHPTTKTKKAIASRIIDLASKSGVMD